MADCDSYAVGFLSSAVILTVGALAVLLYQRNRLAKEISRLRLLLLSTVILAKGGATDMSDILSLYREIERVYGSPPGGSTASPRLGGDEPESGAQREPTKTAANGLSASADDDHSTPLDDDPESTTQDDYADVEVPTASTLPRCAYAPTPKPDEPRKWKSLSRRMEPANEPKSKGEAPDFDFPIYSTVWKKPLV